MAWPNWLGRNGFPTSRVASDSPGTHERDPHIISILQGSLVGVGIGIGGATIQSPCNFILNPLILRCHAESHPFFGGWPLFFGRHTKMCANGTKKRSETRRSNRRRVGSFTGATVYGCRRLEREELQHAASVTSQPFLLVVF